MNFPRKMLTRLKVMPSKFIKISLKTQLLRQNKQNKKLLKINYVMNLEEAFLLDRDPHAFSPISMLLPEWAGSHSF